MFHDDFSTNPHAAVYHGDWTRNSENRSAFHAVTGKRAFWLSVAGGPLFLLHRDGRLVLVECCCRWLTVCLYMRTVCSCIYIGLLLARLIGQILFCSLSSSSSVTLLPGAWAVGRPILHGGPVRLRPVRATPYWYMAARTVHRTNIHEHKTHTRKRLLKVMQREKNNKNFENELSAYETMDTITADRGLSGRRESRLAGNKYCCRTRKWWLTMRLNIDAHWSRLR